MCQLFYFVGWTRRIEDFNYKDMEMANLFHSIMNTTNFEGVSVSIMNTINLEGDSTIFWQSSNKRLDVKFDQ